MLRQRVILILEFDFIYYGARHVFRGETPYIYGSTFKFPKGPESPVAVAQYYPETYTVPTGDDWTKL